MEGYANPALIANSDSPPLVRFELAAPRWTGRYCAALIVNFVLLFIQEQTPPPLALTL
jgi:hypothetical protein